MKQDLEKLLKGLTIKEGADYTCPICKDKGYVLKDDVAYPCTCKKSQSRGLPKKYEGVYLKDFNLKYYPETVVDGNVSADTYYFKAKRIRDAGKKFIKDLEEGRSPKGLFITGKVGSGKRFFIACLYNELQKRGVNSLFLVVPEFLEAVKEEMFADGKKGNTLAKAKKAPILFLDDLGAHNYTPWTINQVYTLLNYRLNNMLPTFMTSNLSIGEIEEALDERIASRIVELFDCCNLSSDEDIRKKIVMEK